MNKKAKTPEEAPAEDTAKPEKPQKKTIYLRQYLVSGILDGKPKAAFILHTGPATANQEFLARFPGAKLNGTTQTAASSVLTKQDVQTRDFWKERLNWEMEYVRQKDSESKKRYFEMKDLAEKNAELRRNSPQTSLEPSGRPVA